MKPSIFIRIRLWALLGLFLGKAVPLLFAQVSFGDLSVSADSRLLFSVRSDSRVIAPEKAWFLADLTSGKVKTLTFPVQSATWIAPLQEVQITNRFGVFRAGKTGMVDVSPWSFASKSLLGTGKLLPSSYSPDGSWALFLVRTSDVSADLDLWNVAAGTLETISKDVELSYTSVPALWSPDGQFFVYEKEGSLYYFSMAQKQQNRVPAEAMRRLGSGLLKSAAWGPQDELYYVRDEVLYRILPQEF
ncbi:MAG: polysaccharide deacetylase family protein, partial [Spirochaetales bacterium]|nr:polysaccharide deacetylase family protein [Spirochaetales bacterium]